MTWEDRTREGLNITLNEAEVVGLRLEGTGAWCDLLLHVSLLPEDGPLDPDRRRILRLLAPGVVSVLLRTDEAETYGDPLPLGSLDDVEAFFASLTRWDAMYGWRFVDDPERTADWPDHPSLTVRVRDGDAAHRLFWFNECGQDEASYCIEGTVTFDEIEVFRADGTPQPRDEFIADGVRQWQAFEAGDERLGLEAQEAALDGTPTWRPYGAAAVRVDDATGQPGGST